MSDPTNTTANSASQLIARADGERWFVLHTLPHREMRAESQIENKRYRTLLPKREKTVRHASKPMTVVAPFFTVTCSSFWTPSGSG
jgi:hypothetical protein